MPPSQAASCRGGCCGLQLDWVAAFLFTLYELATEGGDEASLIAGWSALAAHLASLALRSPHLDQFRRHPRPSPLGSSSVSLGVIDLAIGDVSEGWDGEAREVLNANATNRFDPACLRCAYQPYSGRDVVDDLSRYGRIYVQRQEREFCRRRSAALFVDHARHFSPIGDAIDHATLHGVRTQLFNFPRCTIPPAYRHLARASISDWKRRYAEACGRCRGREASCGFF